MSKENTSQITQKQDLVVTRIIDAPVDRVWKAWTNPEQIKRWWGPKDYTSPSARIDLREGGNYLFSMRAPKEQGGNDQYSGGVYSKILPMKLLEFTMSLRDKDGHKVDPSEVGMPADFPKEIRQSVVFKKTKCNMTELTVTQHDWTVGQMFVYSIAGWHQSIDKLAESLASKVPQ
ncbi:MAG: activator of HSP90 ATPase [Candidatus Thorarchaeota archaeon]|nr:MAG: activator of HSP90 ATPase [Candidatus Thorarchaeota archaeon]